ncbi:hypothetical protein L2E82_11903 [Cichorium intybus]|uniref:Uncharacterized protein n=1 Tax=Cichorium intybus TaxID=13427 RepID=A0ACB9GEL9_CICIN|nr:hypothetical protein L2E82_11903 [Cichorium intybus]
MSTLSVRVTSILFYRISHGRLISMTVALDDPLLKGISNGINDSDHRDNSVQAPRLEGDGDDNDGDFDYAPAASLEGDDDDDGGYDYAPAA